MIPDDMKISDQIRSVKTSFGQTLLFDFVPVQISDNMIIRIYTATGQDYYRGTRKRLFQGVDGVFFVIDSQVDELEHNKEFVEEFHRYVNDIGNNVDVIVLYNKVDLESVHNIPQLKEYLDLNYTSFGTSAKTGENVKEAFMLMVQNCLQKLETL